MGSRTPFIAFRTSQKQLPIIAVDIGYSAKARSCGIAWTGNERPLCLQFGSAIEKVAELCARFEQPLLVVEAALSTFHRKNGNPDIRGSFEEGRGWYWGPGAVSAIAATRFLQKVAGLLPKNKKVLLGEAFLSNKSERTKHDLDAAQIVKDFWRRKPQPIEGSAEPLSHLISGVPSIRVFDIGAVYANKLEFARVARPARKSDALLLAAQP